MTKEKLKIISTFSGIGMQERGIIQSDCYDVEVLSISEIDKDALLGYAVIHCGLDDTMINNCVNHPSKEAMIKGLKSKNIGLEKGKQYNWERLNEKEVKKYWLADKLTNNLGDITKIKSLCYCDMLTFSFPCQSISLAGKMEGIKFGQTRSGLVYEVVRLLEVAKKENKLPKYLLMENVPNLVSNKFICDFNNLNSYFEVLGYNFYWKILNSKDYGIPQNRARVFGIYIRKDIDLCKFEFPDVYDSGKRIKDIIDLNVDKKYYMNKPLILLKGYDCTEIGNNMKVVGKIDFKGMDIVKRVYSVYGICPTLTTMQGGHRQPKILINENEEWKVRKLNPKECMRLMGMTISDYEKLRNIGFSDSTLYKVIGNGLVVDIIEKIIQQLYKAQN